MKNTELPEDMKDVMVTYKKTFRTGPYGDTPVKETVTKRGFYTKLFGYFSVPPEWQYFKGILLPNGWGGDRLKADEVIRWKYCD